MGSVRAGLVRAVASLTVVLLASCSSSARSGSVLPVSEQHVGGKAFAGDVVVLHTFSGGVAPQCTGGASTDGAVPAAGLSHDTSGNVYGTTSAGGPCGAGTVFELVPGQQGVWTYQVIYAFRGSSDGGGPVGALAFDSKGNGFGTATSGGAHGDGVVYELEPPKTPGTSSWRERVIYSFKGLPDGAAPFGDLLFHDGNLYGATERGGHSHIGCLSGCGTIFELRKGSGPTWSEVVLHGFLDANREGANPMAGVAMDADGSLYGTTYYGGDDFDCAGMGCGTVFELKQRGSKWTLHTLRDFKANDGAFPGASVLLDGSRLYGTTEQGGTYNDGTLFRFVKINGEWIAAGRFSFNDTDGKIPSGALTLRSGRIFGTTFTGGSALWGTVYSIGTDPKSWAQQVVYSYTGGSDGESPLYATTLFQNDQILTIAGEAGFTNLCDGNGCGTLLRIAPH